MAKSTINLNALAGGAFAEKLGQALQEVADNVVNPNTSATATRTVTIKIDVKPMDNRELAAVKISTSTKLAPAESIKTQMLIGYDVKTKKADIVEYDGIMKDQMRLSDLPENDVSSKPLALASQA